MNAKKTGLITAGVLAAAVAVAPAAWAFGAQAPDDCRFTAQGTDASQAGEIPGANPINVVTQTPYAGNNQGVFGECSTYGQNNNQGNGEGNTFNGQEFGLPGLPGLPQ